ncbi:MAG: hypothetical protein EHM23_29800 [Acidobacteria bacterium]|nr:MAG: hypothetical protein EHM23_29800 [Acidobacteriota bacterium]
MKHDSNGQTRLSAQEVADVISRYHASGLGLKRFAQEEGIPTGRLHYWLYQKHRAGGPRRLEPDIERVSAPAFQEVKLAGCLPTSAGWAVEISLPNGVTTRFNAAISPVWIGAVVRNLQSPC